MAWRIDEAVIRGEIDNQTRGIVTGRIWFVDRPDPVVLKLRGDCWRDLAGRRLEFTNPNPKAGNLAKFHALQTGVVGDITASRKVKVPEITMEQLGQYYLAKKPFPWHWGNSLYLEWFSQGNGRVVIESAAFELRIIGEPVWEMSPTEEEKQRQANAEAMGGFMERLDEVVARDKADESEPAEWEVKPQTEAEAEQRQERSDRLADRIEARLRREGEDADYEQILEEEIDRIHREEGRPEPTAEQLARNAEWIEDMNRAAEEALANPDPEAEKEMEFEHPLVRRVTEFSQQLRNTAKAEEWRPKGAGNEHPVCELLDATMIAGPKLAGALNGQYWPPAVDICAHTIVRLKRARGYLEDALRATESCQEGKLIKPEHLGPILVELIDLIRDTNELIAELRTRLERGTD